MRNHAATAFKVMGLLAALAPAAALAQSSPSPFTSATRYDAARRVIGTIEPAPGSTSPQTYLAVRNTYDAAGRLVRVEKGALSAWQSEAVAPAQWSGFAVQSQIDTAYDAMDRKTIELVSSASAPYQVTQFSYDALGRLECTAARMNAAFLPAVPSTAGTLSLGSLPSSACTLGTAGSDGPDRITKNVYDAAGQLLQVRKAVGIRPQDVGAGRASEQAYATYSYTPNGKQSYVIDANGNRAQFVYDGFDRPWKWYFPSSNLPTAFNGADQATALSTAGPINSGDYEEYSYDANGNRTGLRKRDGRTFIYTFDALNRVIKKQVPKGCVSGYVCTPPPADAVRDVYYGYDLQGHQLYARFDSDTGEGITNEFDGLGRQISTKNEMDGTARKLSFQYDAAGNRTQVTFPDTQCINYTYDALNRLRDIYQNGVYQNGICQTGSGAKAVSLEWNAQGQLWHHTRGAVTTTYGYDGISRLQSLSDALPNAGQSVTLGFAYNAANQIIQRDRSNDAYRFNGYANADRAYVPNGLNQYAQVGTNTNKYDSNGNLIGDGDFNTGANRYVYDAENRLVTSELNSQSTISLRYDPLGRLFKIFGGSTGTTQLLYDGDQLVAEYAGNGALLRRYVHGTGEDDPLLWYEGAGLSDRRSLQIDQQGSIVSVASASGTASIYSYDEYGNPNSGQTGRFQYTGQAWIPELGLYYYKARMYAPKIGRFLQTDPIGYKDQINLYAYVANDPVNGTDPTGEQCSNPQDGQCPAATAATAATAVAAREGVGAERARSEYKAATSTLAPNDSAGRSAAKASARAATPPITRGVIEGVRPGLGPKAGSGGTANRTSAAADRLAGRLGAAGRVAGVANVVIGVVRVANSEHPGKEAVRVGGGMAGAVAGAEGGAVLGAVGGPWGAAAGGVIGGIVGGFGGEKAVDKLMDWVGIK